MKMKKSKLLITVLVVFATVFALSIICALSASAEELGYSIWVGGVEINDSNAADVLGDGTVSYDASTNILTLNGANISEFRSTDMVVAGVYSEIEDLIVNLVGENRITFPIHDGDMPDGSEIAVFSTKDIEFSGVGKLWSNTYTIGSMSDVVIEDCEISSEWICVTGIGDVNADGATLSGKVGLVNTGSGDITLKNTTVPDGGNYVGMYTEVGDITIENCNVTIYSTVIDEDGTIPIVIGEGGGILTVKNSVLDLKGNLQAILSPSGSGVFENVSGKIEVIGDAAYAMIFGGTVSMNGCDFDISCRAIEDAACGIFGMNDINIENSKLKIDVRTTDESAVCIGGIESPSTNVDVWSSTLKLTASGPNAVGFYGNNVKLNHSITMIEATANATGKGFASGIAAVEGRALVNGGVLDVIVTGPVEHEGPGTVGILMGNDILAPEFVEADVKLRGNQAIGTYPDLSLYGREYELIAATEVNGDSNIEFTKENVESIRYLHVHPFYAIYFDANGGTGEMEAVLNQYGAYTLPQNAFTSPVGKVFKGWALSPNGEVLTDASFIPYADTDLYAIWEDEPVVPDDNISDDETPNDDTPDLIPHTHDHGNEWKLDAENHWKECSCGDKTLLSTHVDSNKNGACDICASQMGNAKKALGTGAIVGIVLGSVAVVGIGGFAIFWFVIKKKSFSDLITVLKKYK